MRVIRSMVPGLLVLAFFAFLAACGGTPEPAETGTGATPQPPPKAEIVKHMHDHLAQVSEVEQAVVRGDLEDARAAAQRFASHEELAGMPPTVRPAIDDMRQAAQKVGQADTLATAGKATAAMVSACGQCHRAMSAVPAFPARPTAEKAANPTVARMLEHREAVNMLYQGLIAPSDELWRNGAQALRAAPLKADSVPVDAALAREALDAQSRAHEAAQRAAEAAAPWERAGIYGELIGECASCHALSGRVLGAGVPKK
jgi:hypothetical protein